MKRKFGKFLILCVWLYVQSVHAAPLTILAEQFNEQAFERLEEGGISIPEFGVVRTAVKVPLSGNHTLTVTAKIEEGKTPAFLNVRIDGIRASRLQVQPSSTWRTYSIPLMLEEGERVFSLEYDAEFKSASPESIGVHSITLVQADRIPGLEASGESDFNRVIEFQQQTLLAEVYRKIETNRKGPLVIQVVDSSGMPVEDATVDIQLIDPDFVFGINHCREVFLTENPIDGHLAYQQNAEVIFSGGGAGEAMSWEKMSPQRATQDSGPLKNIISFNRTHGWQTQSAPLFEIPFEQWPAWMKDLDKEQRLEAIKARMDLLINRSQGTLDPIVLASDVVDSREFGALFDGQALPGLFELAEEVAPGKTYIMTQSNLFRDTVRSDYLEVIEDLLAQGASLQGIGLSLELTESTGLPVLEQLLDQMSLFNLPLYITDLRFSGSHSARSARTFSSQVAVIYSHPEVKSIYFDSLWSSCSLDDHLSWFTQTFEQTALGSIMIPNLTRRWNASTRLMTGPEGLIDTYIEYGLINLSVQFPDGKRQEEHVQHTRGEAGIPTRATLLKRD